MIENVIVGLFRVLWLISILCSNRCMRVC